MEGLSAVIFIPDDTVKHGCTRPLLLREVMGAPLLTWLAESLCADGVNRFFLVCHDRYAGAARACFPADADLMTTMDSNPADLLHVFLSTADDAETEITVVAGPAIYAPRLLRRSGAAKNACVFRASRETLMQVLDANFSFAAFLRDSCAVLSDYDGFYSVESPADALRLAQLLRRNQMLRLCARGVTIYDAESCYVEPTVRVETGATLLPGTMLRGKTVVHENAVIGPSSMLVDSEIGARSTVSASQIFSSTIGADANIGPYAHIREGCVLKSGVKIGNFVELKNAAIGENTWASHLSYLGDAEIGARCNLGCGTVTVNFDRVEKHRTAIGDDAFIGCNSALIAPLTVGKGAFVAAGSTVTEDVPDNALAIARARQSNKKDWAAKHKKP